MDVIKLRASQKLYRSPSIFYQGDASTQNQINDERTKNNHIIRFIAVDCTDCRYTTLYELEYSVTPLTLNRIPDVTTPAQLETVLLICQHCSAACQVALHCNTDLGVRTRIIDSWPRGVPDTIKRNDTKPLMIDSISVRRLPNIYSEQVDVHMTINIPVLTDMESYIDNRHILIELITNELMRKLYNNKL